MLGAMPLAVPSATTDTRHHRHDLPAPAKLHSLARRANFNGERVLTHQRLMGTKRERKGEKKGHGTKVFAGLAAARQQQVLQAARAVFARDGYAGANVNEIAE